MLKLRIKLNKEKQGKRKDRIEKKVCSFFKSLKRKELHVGKKKAKLTWQRIETEEKKKEGETTGRKFTL